MKTTLLHIRGIVAVHGLNLKLESRNWGEMKQKYEGQISNFNIKDPYDSSFVPISFSIYLIVL
ncbi:MAG: hypothetical protein DRP37_08195 [Thermodesulfobacteriota bacterium]|nr:MAG: hypothetical protein DRP37_08195 [Thermodesulfobacteriota bacterium]